MKSFLVRIATDSQKHSIALRGAAESIKKPKAKPKDCEKKIGKSWQIIGAILKDMTEKKKILSDDFPKLTEKLAVMENMMAKNTTCSYNSRL